MDRVAGGAVYIAEALLEGLCQLAADRDPARVAVPIATTSTAELDVDLPAAGYVFTHFYLPDAGRSVRAVFGVDLGIPPRSAPGLFLSHPDGRQGVSRRDDLREVVLVGVPPWEPADVNAFDRAGHRRPLSRVAVTLPDDVLP